MDNSRKNLANLSGLYTAETRSRKSTDYVRGYLNPNANTEVKISYDYDLSRLTSDPAGVRTSLTGYNKNPKTTDNTERLGSNYNLYPTVQNSWFLESKAQKHLFVPGIPNPLNFKYGFDVSLTGTGYRNNKNHNVSLVKWTPNLKDRAFGETGNESNYGGVLGKPVVPNTNRALISINFAFYPNKSQLADGISPMQFMLQRNSITFEKYVQKVFPDQDMRFNTSFKTYCTNPASKEIIVRFNEFLTHPSSAVCRKDLAISSFRNVFSSYFSNDYFKNCGRLSTGRDPFLPWVNSVHVDPDITTGKIHTRDFLDLQLHRNGYVGNTSVFIYYTESGVSLRQCYDGVPSSPSSFENGYNMVYKYARPAGSSTGDFIKTYNTELDMSYLGGASAHLYWDDCFLRFFNADGTTAVTNEHEEINVIELFKSGSPFGSSEYTLPTTIGDYDVQFYYPSHGNVGTYRHLLNGDSHSNDDIANNTMAAALYTPVSQANHMRETYIDFGSTRNIVIPLVCAYRLTGSPAVDIKTDDATPRTVLLLVIKNFMDGNGGNPDSIPDGFSYGATPCSWTLIDLEDTLVEATNMDSPLNWANNPAMISCDNRHALVAGYDQWIYNNKYDPATKAAWSRVVLPSSAYDQQYTISDELSNFLYTPYNETIAYSGNKVTRELIASSTQIFPRPFSPWFDSLGVKNTSDSTISELELFTVEQDRVGYTVSDHGRVAFAAVRTRHGNLAGIAVPVLIQNNGFKPGYDNSFYFATLIVKINNESLPAFTTINDIYTPNMLFEDGQYVGYSEDINASTRLTYPVMTGGIFMLNARLKGVRS